MNVPLAISAADRAGALRTADVFSMVLEWLQIEPSRTGVDGRSRLIGRSVVGRGSGRVAGLIVASGVG